MQLWSMISGVAPQPKPGLRNRDLRLGACQDAHTPADAARALAWDGPDDPGDWQAVTRTFRDGHAETWWAADATGRSTSRSAATRCRL